MLRVPVCLLAFNRTEETKRVLAEIARVDPSELFVVLDGPRAHVPDDVSRCRAVENAVTEIRWRGNLTIERASHNLGCGRRVSTGLTRFFEIYPHGIVLEDDTLPSPDFFRFCEEGLDRFAHDDSIMHLAGSRFAPADPSGRPSRSIHPHIWGWATWARAWKHYEFDLKHYTERNARAEAQRFVDDRSIWAPWLDSFQRVRYSRVDTWDYQWTFACWRARGVSISPPVNLVENVGFGEDATHTKTLPDYIFPAQPLPKNFRWSELKARDYEIDRFEQSRRYGFMKSVSPLKRALRSALWSLGKPSSTKR